MPFPSAGGRGFQVIVLQVIDHDGFGGMVGRGIFRAMGGDCPVPGVVVRFVLRVERSVLLGSGRVAQPGVEERQVVVGDDVLRVDGDLARDLGARSGREVCLAVEGEPLDLDRR